MFGSDHYLARHFRAYSDTRALYVYYDVSAEGGDHHHTAADNKAQILQVLSDLSASAYLSYCVFLAYFGKT